MADDTVETKGIGALIKYYMRVSKELRRLQIIIDPKCESGEMEFGYYVKVLRTLRNTLTQTQKNLELCREELRKCKRENQPEYAPK